MDLEARACLPKLPRVGRLEVLHIVTKLTVHFFLLQADRLVDTENVGVAEIATYSYRDTRTSNSPKPQHSVALYKNPHIRLQCSHPEN